MWESLQVGRLYALWFLSNMTNSDDKIRATGEGTNVYISFNKRQQEV